MLRKGRTGMGGVKGERSIDDAEVRLKATAPPVRLVWMGVIR